MTIALVCLKFLQMYAIFLNKRCFQVSVLRRRTRRRYTFISTLSSFHFQLSTLHFQLSTFHYPKILFINSVSFASNSLRWAKILSLGSKGTYL